MRGPLFEPWLLPWLSGSKLEFRIGKIVVRLIELIILISLAINARSDHDINMWVFHIQGLKITIQLVNTLCSDHYDDHTFTFICTLSSSFRPW